MVVLRAWLAHAEMVRACSVVAGKDLEAQLPYDTLGEVSRKLARERAEKEAAGAAVPGIVVDELIGKAGLPMGYGLSRR